jgi:hypothetical protein
MSAIQVQLFKGSYQPFSELLRRSGISFSERRPDPGKIVASSYWIVIDGLGVGAVLTPLAGVLIAWIRSKASRKVIITTRKDTVINDIQGMSVEEVERILKSAKGLTVIDPAAKDKPSDNSD